jgi:hypothetical protein
MKHLSEEELIELYYDEGERPAAAHLQACRPCAARYKELQQSLNAISLRNPDRSRTATAQGQRAQYGERVWEALRPRLIPYQKKSRTWRGWVQWRTVTLTVGCTMLLATAFLGGRYWEQHTAKKDNIIANASPHGAQRTVLVVLTDHLDRTERLLVALEHADSTDRVENTQIQSEARELLASNRLYRTTASDVGDPVLASALDKLEGVLAEIANNPNLTAKDLEQVRKEMNTDGILFEIRVLMARRPDHESVPNHARGASI